jgi:DNA-3-methyladenine glycosylase
VSPSTDDTPFDPSLAVPVPQAFFERSPVLVAPDLLGRSLVSTVDGVTTGGTIVETEAYLGSGDPGSHASTKGITPRNAVMYGPAGVAYVYFTYGNHFMFNVVCETEGTAGAVLVRALRPVFGVETMTSRRHGRSLGELCNGPGKLCEALGIDLADNGTTLGAGRLAILDRAIAPGEIGVSGRVGLSRGHELPLRYFVAGDPFVSRGRTGPLSPKRRSRNR